MNIINNKVFTNLSVIEHFVTLDYGALSSSFLHLLTKSYLSSNLFQKEIYLLVTANLSFVIRAISLLL